MKRTSIILLIFLLLVPFSVTRAKYKTRSLKPRNAGKGIATVISGKTRYYYPLSAKSASIISLRGPGELRVITRARFKPGEKDKVKYKIWYRLDGGKAKEKKFGGVKRSKKATYRKGTLGVPGQLKDFIIPVSSGFHTLEIKLSEAKTPVAARYLFTPKKQKKRHWIPLTPLSFVEPVDLIAREEVVHYFRFSPQKPLKFEINGPTEVKILTRIENHYNMKGRIQYRLQVKRDGKIVNTYLLSSKRSEITSYKTNSKLIPGKAREIFIEVPKGRHVYEIIPLDKDKSSVLGRILFPKKDVNIEK